MNPVFLSIAKIILTSGYPCSSPSPSCVLSLLAAKPTSQSCPKVWFSWFTAFSLLLPSCVRYISHLRLKTWKENSCAVYPQSPEFQILCFKTAIYCQHCVPKHRMNTEWLALAAGCMGPLHMEETQGNKLVSGDSLLPVCPSLSSYHIMPGMTT